MRILIADDDMTSRVVLAGVLVKEGHEVVTTVNGAEALSAMTQVGAPPLAILDWMMPEMDGFEVLRRLRGIKTDSPPYVIMLTSRGEKTDIIEGLNAGANDYLAKPFDAGELRARVEVGRRMVEMQEELLANRTLLTYQATHDFLTNLPNRRAVVERLGQELARAERQSSLLAIGLCDVDHFKLVNDTYGHQTGDEVLRGLAQLLSDGLRTYDTVGRLGGEEFLILAPIESALRWREVFDRLCRKIERTPIHTCSGNLAVTVSIGAVCATFNGHVDAFLDAADAALYQAKREGRNRVICSERYTPWKEESCAS